MELKWLEDFLVLAERGSFSRAAESRYVTQSAFSRRIRALEAWLGVELIDRSTYPTKLTKAGVQFRDHAVMLLAGLNDARAAVQGSRPSSVDTLHIAVPHTLSLTFFPGWWASVQQAAGNVMCKLTAGNVHDAVMALVEGNADLLLCYHHPQQPVKLDPGAYQVISLGEENLLPYCKPLPNKKPQFSLPGEARTPVPLLAYAPNAFFARILELILHHAPGPFHMTRRYETDMAEALKAMALAGQGIAWLPDSAVRRELAEGRLVPAGSGRWGETMQILLFRQRTSTNPAVAALWQHVAAGG
jgi:DNA-binding transcriptional LysR family regulator